jgi:hypothetical protein
MRATLHSSELPRVHCDFHAQGWTGELEDDCFYVFDLAGLEALDPKPGLRVYAWDYSGHGDEVFGCEAILERFGGGWRLRPASGWRKG